VPSSSPPSPDLRARARDLDRAYGRAVEPAPPAPDPVAERRRRAGRLLLLLVLPLGVATALGLVLLWPSGGPTRAADAAAAAVPVGTTFPHATVQKVTPYDCTPSGGARPLTCGTAVVEITDGDDSGAFQQVDLPATVYAEGVAPGDALVLVRDAGGEGGPSYAFSDFARGTPIWVLALAFVVLVGLVARARGLAALAALGLAFAVLAVFLLPAVLHGGPATAVSLVAAAAIAFVLHYLLSGVSLRTTTALAGTLAAVLVTGLLGAAAVAAARLTGFASGQIPQLQRWDPTLDLSGLVVAAVLVAGLGALKEVTSAQSAVVWRLAEEKPDLGWRELCARALAAGRGRLTGPLCTLLLAYAGASLPLLLLVEVSREPLGVLLTGSTVAELLLRTLVGAVALVLAVPVTTAVGALAARAAGTEAGAVIDRRLTPLLGRFGR
jgi:uncharacterized membrane protein